jgi:hypothetical protein
MAFAFRSFCPPTSETTIITAEMMMAGRDGFVKVPLRLSG